MLFRSDNSFTRELTDKHNGRTTKRSHRKANRNPGRCSGATTPHFAIGTPTAPVSGLAVGPNELQLVFKRYSEDDAWFLAGRSTSSEVCVLARQQRCAIHVVV